MMEMQNVRTIEFSYFGLLLVTLSGCFAFFDYGLLRTLETTIGFDLRTTTLALAITMLPSLVFAGLGMSIYYNRKKFLVCIQLAIASNCPRICDVQLVGSGWAADF